MTTMLSLTPLQVIELYGYRFKIEVSFKQALYTLGTYAYHFWMMHMTPIRRRGGNQHLHHKTEKYREMVVGQALRSSLPHFLAAMHGSHELEKRIIDNADLSRLPDLRISAWDHLP